MDEKFLKFWGDMVEGAIKETTRLKDLTDWVNQKSSMSGTVAEMFKKYYGLDKTDENTAEYSELFGKAAAQFNESLSNFYSALNVVPKKEYQDLEKKYAALQKKVTELEEVIKHLKILFKTHAAGGEPDIEKGIKSLNQMLKSQNKKFIEMMDSLAGFYGLSEGENK
jgi:wobble nucleotide-excising tRNase